MKVNEIYVSLDGRKNGVAIFLQTEQNMVKCRKDQQVVDKLFRSVNLAKIFLKVALGITDPRDYSLVFVIDGRKFGYIESGFYNNHYIIYDRDPEKEPVKYIVSEGESDQVVKLGYLVFENNPDTDEPKDQRQLFQKSILNNTKSKIQEMMLENRYFEKVSKDPNGHICAQLKFSSAKIHICMNPQLIKLNQERKQKQIRCLPFDKNIDTYSSLYCYITKDVHECDGFGSAELAIEYLDELVTRLQEINKEIYFYAVEFKGEIRV